MNRGPKECLFCRSSLAGVRTREHVIPQWLLDHMGIRDTDVTPWHAHPDGSTHSVRKHKLEDLKEGRVCVACNTGWMSRLESSARPLLVSLISAKRVTADLSRPERNILAHWAMKTAFLLNSASNYHHNVPAKHFWGLSHDTHSRLPTDVMVFAQQHRGTQAFFWLQGATWQTLNIGRMKPRTLDKLGEASYKITLQFGKLLLLVAHWPHPGWRPGIWLGIHVPMWPPRKPCVFHGADKEFAWDDSTDAILQFHCGLVVYREHGPAFAEGLRT